MKRVLFMALCFIAGLVIGASAIWFISKNQSHVNGRINNTVPGSVIVNGMPDPGTANSQLLGQAYFAASYIKTGDYESLASLVHPEYGLVFSPNPTVNLSSNLSFNASEVYAFSANSTVYFWGVSSRTNEPIELTPKEYLAVCVYSRDFINASTLGVNRILRSGNALENVMEVFPDSYFIDFYIPGDSDDGTDIGWQILRLVFEEYDGSLRLTAVINSEYTV